MSSVASGAMNNKNSVFSNQLDSSFIKEGKISNTTAEIPILGKEASIESWNSRASEDQSDGQFEDILANMSSTPKTMMIDDTELRESITSTEGKIN